MARGIPLDGNAKNTMQISLRLPKEDARLAARLVAEVRKQSYFGLTKATRADILRMVVSRGLEDLQEDLRRRA
jgi:hypothetical protein